MTKDEIYPARKRKKNVKTDSIILSSVVIFIIFDHWFLQTSAIFMDSEL